MPSQKLGELYYEITARGDKLATALGQAQSGLAKLTAGIGAATLAWQGFQDALDQDRAEQKLSAALSKVTGEFAKQTEAMKDFATTMQQITLVDDAAVVRGMSRAVAVLGIQGEELKTLTVVAVGLSKALEVDVASGFDVMIKAVGGNFTALQRLLPTIDKAATAQEKLNKVVEFGKEKFIEAEQATGGMAGGYDRLKMEASEATESAVGSATQFSAGLLARWVSDFRHALDFWTGRTPAPQPASAMDALGLAPQNLAPRLAASLGALRPGRPEAITGRTRSHGVFSDLLPKRDLSEIEQLNEKELESQSKLRDAVRDGEISATEFLAAMQGLTLQFEKQRGLVRQREQEEKDAEARERRLGIVQSAIGLLDSDAARRQGIVSQLFPRELFGVGDATQAKGRVRFPSFNVPSGMDERTALNKATKLLETNNAQNERMLRLMEQMGLAA